MEKTKLNTIDSLMNAKTPEEAEIIIRSVLRSLEEHRVHEHLIARFCLKLSDQLLKNRKTCNDDRLCLILDQSISLLKQLNYS